MPVFAVATATDPNAGNYPPSAWLTHEGWPYPVLVDTAHQTAANAYGLTGHPFLVFVDGHGRVTGRIAAEVGPDTWARILAALAEDRPLPIPGTFGASSAA